MVVLARHDDERVRVPDTLGEVVDFAGARKILWERRFGEIEHRRVELPASPGPLHEPVGDDGGEPLDADTTDDHLES